MLAALLGPEGCRKGPWRTQKYGVTRGKRERSCDLQLKDMDRLRQPHKERTRVINTLTEHFSLPPNICHGFPLVKPNEKSESLRFSMNLPHGAESRVEKG